MTWIMRFGPLPSGSPGWLVYREADADSTLFTGPPDAFEELRHTLVRMAIRDEDPAELLAVDEHDQVVRMPVDR